MEAENQTETSNIKSEEEPGGQAREDAGEAATSGLDSSPAYQKLLAEKQDLYDRLLRKQAELDNFRKRMQREKEEFLQHANADLIRSLLPALDAFERALKHPDPAAPEKFYEGIQLIHRQLLDALGRAGLKTVEAEGKTFDPELHQAVETVEAKEHHRDQQVVEELQRGYQLRHRLIRPAVVKVAVHPRKQAEDSSPDHSSDSN